MIRTGIKMGTVGGAQDSVVKKRKGISTISKLITLTLTSHGLYPDARAAADVTTPPPPLPPPPLPPPPPPPVPPVLYLLVAPPELCGYDGGGGCGGAWYGGRDLGLTLPPPSPPPLPLSSATAGGLLADLCPGRMFSIHIAPRTISNDSEEYRFSHIHIESRPDDDDDDVVISHITVFDHGFYRVIGGPYIRSLAVVGRTPGPDTHTQGWERERASEATTA